MIARERILANPLSKYKMMVDMLDERHAPKPECGDIEGTVTIRRLLDNKLIHLRILEEEFFGAALSVSRKQKRNHTKFHNKLKGHSTHCLMYEVIWHVLFGEADVLPMRGENPDLPLFLRARDVSNESYLPPGSQYMTTVMSMSMEEEETGPAVGDLEKLEL